MTLPMNMPTRRPPLINRGSGERQGRDTTNLVHGADQAGPDTLVLAVEVLKEVFLVAEQTAEHHGVVTVHGLAEEADRQACPQH